MTKQIALLIILNFPFTDVDAALSSSGQGINYRTYFGQCPSRVVGKLALQLVKVFEQTKSLKSVKEKLLKDHLKGKYYLSSYHINYHPLTKLLRFSFECPAPLMKVLIYKEGGVESYSAILVDNGQLFDPIYEALLRSEEILSDRLPSLGLPLGGLDQEVQLNIARLVKMMNTTLRKNLSEVIISEENDLTAIFSIKNRASSAFLGKDQWDKKLQKLQKIMDYMAKKKKVPSIINLTDVRKIVVKFSDKF